MITDGYLRIAEAAVKERFKQILPKTLYVAIENYGENDTVWHGINRLPIKRDKWLNGAGSVTFVIPAHIKNEFVACVSVYPSPFAKDAISTTYAGIWVQGGNKIVVSCEFSIEVGGGPQ
jgi:hypothetical protein